MSSASVEIQTCAHTKIMSSSRFLSVHILLRRERALEILLMPRSLGYKKSKRRKLYGYGTGSFCNISIENFTHLVKLKKHFRRSNCGDYVNTFISTPFREYSDNKEKSATSVANRENFTLTIPGVFG